MVAVCACWTQAGSAQAVAPSWVQWQKTYGGNSAEGPPCLPRTSDGGFILGSQSYSGISGNKGTTNYGDSDYWILRLDRSGNEIWEANLGGSARDRLWGVTETSDGGVVAVGESSSYGLSDSNIWSGPVGNKTAPRLGGSD